MIARTTLLVSPRDTSPVTPSSFVEVMAEAENMQRGRKAMIVVVNANRKTVFLMSILINSYYITVTGKFKLKLTSPLAPTSLLASLTSPPTPLHKVERGIKGVRRREETQLKLSSPSLRSGKGLGMRIKKVYNNLKWNQKSKPGSA
jgi:hypothetical protein